MADEYFPIKGFRQIVPVSGLWLRQEPAINRVGAEFVPVVAFALVEIEPESPAHFLDLAYLPITAQDIMYGYIPRTPFLGLRLRYSLYHDADFEQLGFKLKDGAEPRSPHFIPDIPHAVPANDIDMDDGADI